MRMGGRGGRTDSPRVRIGTALAATFVALLVLVASALADRTGVTDPRGDSPDPFYDYAAASAGHAPKNRLDHRITTVRRATPVNAGVLEIDTGGRAGCEYAIAKFTYGRTVINCHSGQEAGNARIERIRPRTFSFSFRAAMIGNPASYRWRWQNGDDKLPNRGWKKHDLR
jgi:hypothetical protein